MNPAQRHAVQTLSGPLLVLAGAGTGKTRVITHRIVELIRSGIQPDRILSVTFTNKAAREMQERTAALLGGRKGRKPLISTFHSLCVRILRQEIGLLGYPLQFTIYDRGDQESVARTALRDIRIGEKSFRPGDLLARISRWKMSGIFPDKAADHVEYDLDFLAAIAYRKYQQKLKDCGAVDFDDLLMLTNLLFERHPDVLTRQQQRFDHVQIDEYQDTNGSQFDLIQALVRPHRNLCVVGDDDQSIYGWRGAEVRHILGFQQHFPGATVVRLEDNYRCTDKILDVANRLVRHNPGRHEKQLIPHKFSEDDVRIFDFATENSEAEAVVREIKYLVEQEAVPPGEIAILFRTNEQPRLFESEFRRASVNYTLIGSQSFFDRREIRDLLAYLKTLAFPSDEVSLLRIINTPSRGIGSSTIEKLMAQAVAAGVPIWSIIDRPEAVDGLPAKAAAALTQFRDLIIRYRAKLQHEPKNMQQLLQDLIREINYEGEIQKQYKTADQQLARSEMLDQFLETVHDYVSRSDDPSASGFLEECSLTGRDEDTSSEDQLTENAVKLMTLHSAKGLEFPRVYLVGLEEGILPHHRSLESADSAIAEERRLAYVGVTRARDHLTITRAGSRMKWGKRRETLPSRFLFEMREDYSPQVEIEFEIEIEDDDDFGIWNEAGE